MTTGFDLDEIERLLAAATPGEWVTGCGFERNYLYGGGEHLACIGGRGDYEINDDGSPNEADNNADLIATLKCSAPAMIAAIRELRAENARLKKAATTVRNNMRRGVTGMQARKGWDLVNAALGEPQ